MAPSSETVAEPAIDPRFAELRRTGDLRLRDGLILDHRWVARLCASRYKDKGESSADLHQVAMLGLVKAVDRFDPGFGVVFSTFAVPTIEGELRRHFRDHTWAVRVRRQAKDNHRAVSDVTVELEQVLGRSPTIEEIAERAGIDIDEVLEALDVGAAYRSGPLAAGDDDRNDDTRRALGVEEPGYGLTEARMVVPGLIAALPTERERRIVTLRFVEDLSQSRIAREIGISQVQVSRILRSCLARMRHQLTLEQPRRPSPPRPDP
jgi:RNA polymerase sigma-B factor